MATSAFPETEEFATDHGWTVEFATDAPQIVFTHETGTQCELTLTTYPYRVSVCHEDQLLESVPADTVADAFDQIATVIEHRAE